MLFSEKPSFNKFRLLSTVGAMAAFFQKVPVGHVEAGLRTYDLESPFPEELNRQVTSNMARLHFAPTVESCLLYTSDAADE